MVYSELLMIIDVQNHWLISKHLSDPLQRPRKDISEPQGDDVNGKEPEVMSNDWECHCTNEKRILFHQTKCILTTSTNSQAYKITYKHTP
jgi:hypothetical protein